jgi:L-ascorbate metabolism protein UlaG (beta-lactamase superfamily)
MAIEVQRLNMDNSWWVKVNNSSFLIDPWLEGEEIDFFKWFNTQWHRTTPIAYDKIPDFDFVVITQKYPDHFHEVTLRKLNPKKLLVPKSIEKKVKRLLPQSEVLSFVSSIINVFDSALNFHHIPTSRKIDPIYDSMIFENGEESVFISTHGHGLDQRKIERISKLPPVSVLFTPFNFYQLPVVLGGTVSPGLEGVNHLVEVLNPKRVLATHDEDKYAKGLVSRFARIARSPKKEDLISLEWLKDRYLELTTYEPARI